MSLILQIFLIAIIVIFFATVIALLRSGKLSLKYSLVWFFAAVVLLIMVIFPDLPQYFSELIGVEVASNFVFLAEGIFVLIILISLTVIVSKQSAKILRLTQSLATLEKRVRELENKPEE